MSDDRQPEIDALRAEIAKLQDQLKTLLIELQRMKSASHNLQRQADESKEE